MSGYCTGKDHVHNGSSEFPHLIPVVSKKLTKFLGSGIEIQQFLGTFKNYLQTSG